MSKWIKEFFQKYHIGIIIAIGVILFAEGSLLAYCFGFFNEQTTIYYVEGSFLTLLGILLAFLGLVGVGIYLWISRTIEDNQDKATQDGRYFAEAQMLKVGGLASYSVYITYRELLKLYLLTKEVNEQKENKDKTLCNIDKALERSRKEAQEYISDAIQRTELAIKLIKKLDTEESVNELLMCICNNNLAYYLVERNKGNDLDRAKILTEDIKSNIKKYPDHSDNWLDTLEFVNQALAKQNTLPPNPNKGN